MKTKISLVILLVVLGVLLVACGDKSVYALSGNVQLKYEDGTAGKGDLAGSTVTVESVKVWPEPTVYESSGWESDISIMVEMTLKVPESWSDEQRVALLKDLDFAASYEDGTRAFDSSSRQFASDTSIIEITLTGGPPAGKEISFVLSVNGEKIKGGEFKRHIN